MKLTTRTYIFLIAALPALVYVILRAALVSFTHDESLSFTIVAGLPEQVNTANNHLLNTELMRLCSNLFGNGEFSLRLPNVLAFVLFLWAAYRILMKTVHLPMTFSFAVLVLLVNPYMIEFFALARGYGLSLAFMLAGIYFLLLLRDESTFRVFLRNAALALLMAGLSLWSNLALINFFIVAMLLVGLFFFIRARVEFSARQLLLVLLLVFASCVPLYLGMQRLLFLKEANELYIGADKLIDTAKSVLYTWEYVPETTESWPVALNIFIYAVLAIICYILYRRDFTNALAFMALLIGMLVCGLVLENRLFDAKFPLGRTALYFAPLLVLLFAYLPQQIRSATYPRIRKGVEIVLLAFACRTAVYFVANMNLTSARDWPYDAHTKEVALHVNEEAKKQNRKLRISNAWVFEPTLNFYIRTKNLSIHPSNRDGIWEGADFICDFTENKQPQGFLLVQTFPDSKTQLLQKR